MGSEMCIRDRDEGDDRYIEANRGKLFKAPSPEAEELDEEEDEEEEELTAEDIDNNDLEILLFS